ncbi:unannotated protein [freshwater metagenome]|uniref:Unannotated protein n=1 Tax=freshwater metagenome TaxID=449393 RepID=A0A6J7AQS3_9ZZZZ
MRRGHGRGEGLGDLDVFECDPEVLGHRLDRVQVGLADPLGVRHVVGGGNRLGQRPVERQRVREREEQVVVLDRGHVDRSAGQFCVTVEQRVEVAEGDDGVAHPPRRKIHHRVAEVTKFDVHHGGEVPIDVVELTGVPHHWRLTLRRRQRVAIEPAEHELHQRIGAHLDLAEHAHELTDAHVRGVGRRVAAGDAGIDERLQRQRVETRELLQILVHDHGPFGRRSALEIGLPRYCRHRIGAGFVAPAVDVGHGDSLCFEHLLEAHLVIEGELLHRVAALAAHDDAFDDAFDDAVAFDVDEPHRPPTWLTRPGDDLATEQPFQPGNDLGVVVGHVQRSLVSKMQPPSGPPPAPTTDTSAPCT